MLVYKDWVRVIKDRKTGIRIKSYKCDGWFVFGVFPLYLRRFEVK